MDIPLYRISDHLLIRPERMAQEFALCGRGVDFMGDCTYPPKHQSCRLDVQSYR